MIELWSPLGAVIACWALSRVTWRLLRLPNPLLRLVGAHLLSFGLLFATIGLAKAYFSPFAFGEAAIVALPQLFWLAIDWVRGRASTATSRGSRDR